MTPLNVLQIVPSISLVYGGPSQMVRGLSAALSQVCVASEGNPEGIPEGHLRPVRVTVITTDSNGDVDEAPLSVPLGVPIAESGYETLYFRCSPFRRYKFSSDLLSWLWANAHRYDIAHIHALFSPVSTSAATVCRWKKLPYIMRPLGTLDPADLQKKKQVKRLYAQLLERPNLAGAAAIHFTSDLEAKVSERFGVQTPATVIPLGVSGFERGEAASRDWAANRAANRAALCDRFQIPPERPILLFMSRVDPKKGFDLLLPALAKLHEMNQPFHCLICGANPQDRAYETSIREQIEASPWAAWASWVGFVSGELKAQILSGADVFVLPSYYENFGIAVAEAMAAGLPVVISDQVHIWPTIQSYEAGWVVPTEVTALTTALAEALAQPAVRSLRGENAQRCVAENYSWDAIAQRMANTYAQLLANNPPK
jgi:glycosyltransferase involved in cell wall biosynthesis